MGMDTEMIVCLCKGVSDRQVRQAIGEGHTSLKAIARRCGAGTGLNCGACHESLRAMITETTVKKADVLEPAKDGVFDLASDTPTG